MWRHLMPSYLEIQQEAQRLLQLRPVYVECKASGSHLASEVVEIAVIEHDGGLLLDELVRPKGRIEVQASRQHGITPDVARLAPPWPEVWSKVRPVLEGRMIGIYGLEQTLALMQRSHRRTHLRWEMNTADFFCIMKLHSLFAGQLDERAHAYRTFPLEQAAESLGLDAELFRSRRALDDARLVRAVLMALAGWKIR